MGSEQSEKAGNTQNCYIYLYEKRLEFREKEKFQKPQEETSNDEKEASGSWRLEALWRDLEEQLLGAGGRGGGAWESGADDRQSFKAAQLYVL